MQGRADPASDLRIVVPGGVIWLLPTRKSRESFGVVAGSFFFGPLVSRPQEFPSARRRAVAFRSHFIGTACVLDHAEAASKQWRVIANQFASQGGEIAALMAAEPDVSAFMNFPKVRWRKIHSRMRLTSSCEPGDLRKRYRFILLFAPGAARAADRDPQAHWALLASVDEE